LRVTYRKSGYEDLAATQRLMQTYASIITGRVVKAELGRQLGITYTPNVSVDFPANTELMEISVSHENPQMAADIANTLAQILFEQTRNETDYTVRVIGEAVPPESSSAFGTRVFVILGLMAGVGAGVVVAFLWENLDSSLYTRHQIETVSGLSTLAEIPEIKKKQLQAGFLNGTSVAGEAFRQLRTRLFVLDRQSSLRTMLLTSAEPNQGKSTVASNLAVAIAHAGRSVVIVDADMRQPHMHTAFGLSNECGLSTFLEGQASLDDALRKSHVDDIHVLTSGPAAANPSELFSSPQMNDLLLQLSERFDMVLIDAPALLAVADAAVLASLVDGVLLVVGRTRASSEALQEANRRLAGLQANPLGVVVNYADQHAMYDYYKQAK
jgi:capsular exopolysaccharide synthesis family protein